MSFVWCDLSAFQPAEAARFYQGLLGWEVEGGDYAMASAAGAPVAAIYPMPQRFREMGMPSFWMSYIAVASVAETVARARDAGGRIELETRFGKGEIALVRDPLGAGFTIYEGEMPPGARGHGAPGLRAGHTLMVSSRDVAGFYGDVFGWDCVEASRGWHLTDGGSPVAELHEVPEAERGGFEYWGVVFSVPDLAEAAQQVLAAGGQTFRTTELSSGPALAAADRDGAAFFLTETAP
ncbi:MAG: VOC family protein [Pseudomonadota bacterium]